MIEFDKGRRRFVTAAGTVGAGLVVAAADLAEFIPSPPPKM